ncbi:glycoside hydrolase family 2 TIM barrel-domain containing protein [Povalibacter uvarum]
MKLTDGKAHANLRLMPGTRMKLQVYRDAQRQQPLLSADDAPGRFVQAVAGADDTTISLTEKLCDQCVVAQAKSTLGNFNGNWQFHRAADVDADVKSIPSSQWVEVTVPHTARIEPRIVNDQWQGIAFYRKAFAAEPSWRGKQVWLRFEGAMNVAEVRFNGRVVTTHLGGYLPFVVDLTKGLKFDAANELVVRLDNRDNAVTGPKPLKVLDFNMYGGLYRDVSLIVKSPVHITDEIMEAQPGGGGIFVTYPAVSRDKATVAVKTHLRNTSRAKASFRIVQALSKDGREVARHVSTSTTLAAGANVSVAQQFDVGQPSLWSPRSPSLYQLRTIVETSEGTVDERHTRIGIRRIDIAPGKFAINGEATFLRGVNRHQEYPYVGYALSPEADYRDAKRIKEAGFDFVRLSHYPHSSHFMAAADELGLVLLDSIPGWQFFNPDPAFERQVLQTCRDMIRRDRNHPSVIAWECSLNETQMPTSLVQRFNEIVHEEYPGDQAYSAGWQDDGYDVYIQARQHRIEHYEPPKRPYLVSEYGDWEYYALNAGFQQHTWANLKEEDRTSRQLLGAGEARLLQQALNNQEAHNDNFSTPAFADAYWVMFDYNRGYAEDLEASGVMSLERLPKFNYQFFRTQRAADEVSPRFEAGPAVFIASYWLPDSSTRVRVFGNVDEVQLFLNGRSVARQRPDRDRVSDRLRHPPFTFDVGKYEAGTLDAVGYRNGRAIALHRVITPEAPERLQIEIDDAGVCSATDAADLVFARARVLDRNGAAVPADRSVQFSAAGSAELVGEKDQRAEAGIASALLRVSRTTAHANVFASSGPLTAQQIWLRPACISAIP